MSHSAFLRNLLLARSEWMEERVMVGARRNGYSFVTPAMNRLFAHMSRQPVGLSELARRLAVSRQFVHKLANEAATHGLVEFVESETDGRIKLLRFTEKGWAMVANATEELQRIEQELIDTLGEHDVRELRRILARAWPET